MKIVDLLLFFAFFDCYVIAGNAPQTEKIVHFATRLTNPRKNKQDYDPLRYKAHNHKLRKWNFTASVRDVSSDKVFFFYLKKKMH